MTADLKQKIKETLGQKFEGELADDPAALSAASRDASLFEVRPKLVAFPKNSKDIGELVKFVSQNKSSDPTLSITTRAAGSCMSGGSLNESIILDVTKHIHGTEPIAGNVAVVRPGTFYRDFELETLKHDLILPCYTASKNLCAIGGMVGNNAAGEKTLRYGKMENFICRLKVIFTDGREYLIEPLRRKELDAKMGQDDFEGEIYRKIFGLIQARSEEIKAAKPKVSKNSAGYGIWNVWDEKNQIFDLTRLIVGSQGTLGIVTEVTLKLEPVKPISKLFVIFMPKLDRLGDIVNEILKFKPESLESYDDSTMKLAVRFLPEMLKSMKAASFFKLIFSFLPETLMMLTGGVPKLILLVEFSGTSTEEGAINGKMKDLARTISHFGFQMRVTRSPAEVEKYWTIRRESFNLLRKHIRGRRTAPFVDDVVVLPEHLPKFLPEMRAVLDKYGLLYTIAGHAGNGNFHIIPLMDMKDQKNRAAIRKVSDEIYDLIAKYHGSITGEHNDGIIRTPYLGKMFSSATLEIFAEIKQIFDSQNIFNPGKKVGGSLEYMENHLARS